MDTCKEVLVIGGGGIKGLAILGALALLYEKALLDNISTYAGTSVGGIISCMLLLGYSPKELFEYILKYDLSNIKNINIENILEHFCIDNGNKLENFLHNLLKNKGIAPEITLLELYTLTKKRLVLTTVCLNDPSKPVYLRYKTHPNLSVITALRMTSALMPYYGYIEYQGDLYGDGGYIDNYPMRIFRDKLKENKVIGLFTMENIKYKSTKEINTGVLEYLGRLFECFKHGIDVNCVKGFEKYTILISVDFINVVEYGIGPEKKKELYDIGYEFAEKSSVFLSSIKKLD